MNVKEALGQRIKILRHKIGYTQERFAEAAGLAPRHISRIENGINTPSVETLARMAGILGVEVKELFDFPYMDDEKYLKSDIQKILNTLDYDELKLVHRVLNGMFR